MNPRSSNSPADGNSRSATETLVGFLAQENEIPRARLP
jgi:hypothetical protein